MLATLDRRPETYHETIREAAARLAGGQASRERITRSDDAPSRSRSSSKVSTELLVYDRHPRKALVDHFYPLDVTLDDLAAGRDVERGDFAVGTYLSRSPARSDGGSAVVMERPGRAGGHTIRIRKTIEVKAGSPELVVSYLLEDLPRDECLHFAVEINLAAMAGHAPDRYYSDPSGASSGCSTPSSTCPTPRALTLTDEWLDLSVGVVLVARGGRLVLPDPDRQPERRRLRGRLPVVGRHPPLARHRRRTRAVGGPGPHEPRPGPAAGRRRTRAAARRGLCGEMSSPCGISCRDECLHQRFALATSEPHGGRRQ